MQGGASAAAVDWTAMSSCRRMPLKSRDARGRGQGCACFGVGDGCEPAVLAQHAAAVLSKLEDEDEFVRREASKTLDKLSQKMWRSMPMRSSPSSGTREDVRTAAVKTLGSLSRQLAQHAAAVVAS